MTTTSVSNGYIDYPAFGVGEQDLLSLKALAALWQAALRQVAEGFDADGLLDEFVDCSAELPLRMGDFAWQTEWLRTWHKLSGRGFALSEMFQFLNSAIAACEDNLYGEQRQISRVQLDLMTILRRCVVASVSCAIELGEEASHSEAGIPSEFAAMHTLRELAAAGRQAAVLSVAMDSQQAFAHLTAAELHSLPGLLTEQLTALLRTDDLVFGGREGEWLLILPDILSLAQPALAASQIQRAFAVPLILLSGRNLQLEAVIGAAVMPDHGDDPAMIVQAARLARLGLKNSGEKYAMFDDAIRRNWTLRQTLAEELAIVLRHDGLQLYMQPQFDAASGECFGAELLLRWQRANGDWVPPPTIIEIVAESGWRSEFTNWLIRAAMRLGAEMDAAEVPVALSVNLTADDLLDTDLPDLVAQFLESWRQSSERFTFELTESALMVDRERCLSVMSRLRALGFRLALDDFGTGYSSLSYLVTLPLNEIKIDRSFIVGMQSSEDALRIVRTIVDLTHDLGMNSLAEGVEETGQREQLLALGCRAVQGYLFGKPMSPAAFIDWYRNRQA